MKNNEWRKKCWSMFVFQRLWSKLQSESGSTNMISIVTDTAHRQKNYIITDKTTQSLWHRFSTNQIA